MNAKAALRLIEKKIKCSYLMPAELRLNKWLKREFLPTGRAAFCIETSSACNLKCRFCAYEKKRSPRVSMPDGMFRDCVEQALQLGFREFGLTPTTGDVFMDKNVFNKFRFLDSHPQVQAYHFFTNFTVVDAKKVRELVTVKKLSSLVISIYGHDEKSFVEIAKSSPKIYRRLLSNLETLISLKDSWPFSLAIGWRSTFDVPKTSSSDLMILVDRLRALGVSVNPSHGLYNNWGGMITEDDVAGLNIKIWDDDTLPKLGPCAKLFDGFQVMATGVVNGCSCRDVDATLQIGNVATTPLKDILSRKNELYMELIQEQEQGFFRPVCRNCDFYRSVYHQPTAYRKKDGPRPQSTARFLDGLEVRDQGITAAPDTPASPRPAA